MCPLCGNGCGDDFCFGEQADGAKMFVLDTSKLTVGTVTVGGDRARWVQHRRHSVYGAALEVKLPGAETGVCHYARGQLLQVGALL